LKSLLSQFGLQVRAINNDIMKQIAKIEETGGDFSELFPLISGERARQVWKNGDAEHAMLTVGQSVGLIDDIPTVDELIQRMIKDACETLKGSLEKLS